MVTSLKKKANSQNELTFRQSDIVTLMGEQESNLGHPSSNSATNAWLLENSLKQYARYMYLKHPSYLRLSINKEKIEMR